jgi:hypothetical protein
MVFLAARAVKWLVRPQLKHAFVAGKEFLALDKHLRPSSALVMTNLTFHEGLHYRK